MYIVKRCLLTIFTAVLSLLSTAQTSYQKKLVDDFIVLEGGSVIAGFAHPTCKSFSKIVYAGSNHEYTIDIGYGYGEAENFRFWSCSYIIKFSSYGELLSLAQYMPDSHFFGCKGPNLKCFHLCDISRQLISEFTLDEKNRVENLLKKTLDEFSCIDFCFARLWLKWSLSYKSRY